jgi:hypothetical protein
MSNYNLNLLGTVEFEHLIQDLLKRIIGAGTITFGTGPDGVREPHMKAVGVSKKSDRETDSVSTSN